jgi:hypothetical protein
MATKSQSKKKKAPVKVTEAPEAKKQVKAPEKETTVKIAPERKVPEKPTRVRKRGQVVEIPIFNSKVKAVFVMERGNETLFRGVGPEKFTIQVPTKIVPDVL